MKRFVVLACGLVSLAASAALPADGAPKSAAAVRVVDQRADLTAAQIVEKHVAARGGLQVWRAVQAMSFSGKMDAGRGDLEARGARIARGAKARIGKMANDGTPVVGDKGEANKQVKLPFLLEMKRPDKSRLEIEFAGKTALQVYDGTSGWKLRPYLNRNDVEPFTAEEAKSEAEKAGMDGPLVDYAAKGTTVERDGVESVEGRDAYKVKLTTKSGNVQHVWIDAKSFLDVKVEGTQRRMDGRMRNVWIFQRDFRAVQGLMIPFVLETAIEGFPETHKIVIDKVAVNPRLDDTLFKKPAGGSAAALPAIGAGS